MLWELLATIARKLDAAGIPYMIIGGQAVIIHAEPRFTNDIDVTLGCGPERLHDVLQVAQDASWDVLVENPETFVNDTWVLPCKDCASGARIDLIFSFSPYETQALERTHRVEIEGTMVAYASVEDVIIHKIVAGRSRDLEDVKNLLLANPDADIAYITHWLRQFESALNEPCVERFEAIRAECS